MNKKNRLDYFIVWGHAIDHLPGIVNIIAESEEVDILYIKKKNIVDLSKFIDDIYAKEWPSVPKQHTLDKSSFLYVVPKEVALILVMNKNPSVRIQSNKNPLFRMPESETIKNIKTKIRGKYDPNKGGKGLIQLVPGYNPDQHVVHASDFPEQIQNALDIFEMKDVNHWHQYWQNKHHPSTMKNNSINAIFVDIDSIFMNILDFNKNVLDFNKNIISVRIKDSPHYEYLCGRKEAYIKYWNRFCGDILRENHSPIAFEKLANNFQYLRVPYQNCFIKVHKHDDSYISFDGDHRLAIVKYLGYKKIQVEVV